MLIDNRGALGTARPTFPKARTVASDFLQIRLFLKRWLTIIVMGQKA